MREPHKTQQNSWVFFGIFSRLKVLKKFIEIIVSNFAKNGIYPEK
tara:strand:- start:613 stop:747 length:135 start_codon:yes stop_codon:yes gene_type:complete